MRSKSLLKKIGAAFTAVAVLASIGITAFAAEAIDDATVQSSGEGVTATVEVTETATDGVYNVAVNYQDHTNSEIGVTMLAYADTVDGVLGSDDIPYGYNGDKMQIVGIDQSSEKSGTFNFLVDTTKTNSNAVYMNEGDVGIVLLSADGAAAPTGYLFEIPFVITRAEASAAEITVPYGTAIEDVKTLLNALTITVYGEEDEETWTANNWTVADYEDVEGRYTATGTLVAPDGAKGVNKNGVTVSVDVVVGAAPVTAWVATKGTLEDINVTVDAGADVAAAVKKEIVGKPITVADATDTYSAQVTVTEAMAETVVVNGATGTVTVAAGTEVTGVPAGQSATVGADFTVTFTVNVTENGGGDEPGTGETYIVGDADGDGEVLGADWLAILGWLNGNYSVLPNPNELDLNTNIKAKAADADDDGEIAGSDWLAILAWINTGRDNGVGVIKTFN